LAPLEVGDNRRETKEQARVEGVGNTRLTETLRKVLESGTVDAALFSSSTSRRLAGGWLGGSLRWRSRRWMDFGSVTTARSFILPLQVGH
jgi:hypothetical protein